MSEKPNNDQPDVPLQIGSVTFGDEELHETIMPDFAFLQKMADANKFEIKPTYYELETQVKEWRSKYLNMSAAADVIGERVREVEQENERLEALCHEAANLLDRAAAKVHVMGEGHRHWDDVQEMIDRLKNVGK